jgi:hypothetical protein
MAKIWVKGYTRPDGTKVKGHWRSGSPKDTAVIQAGAGMFGGNPYTRSLNARQERAIKAFAKKEGIQIKERIYEGSKHIEIDPSSIKSTRKSYAEWKKTGPSRDQKIYSKISALYWRFFK